MKKLLKEFIHLYGSVIEQRKKLLSGLIKNIECLFIKTKKKT